MSMSPPYAPQTAALGGVPTIGVDVPIAAVFLVLYVFGAASHMYILQTNRKRSHKFLLSGMIFGFCMARTVTMIMRISWACRPMNIRIAIASMVFTAAGVVLLFVVNLLFAQRILRAQHPNAGWHKIIHFAFLGVYALIILTLIMLITTVVQQFYTLNANTHRIDRAVILYGGTMYAVISFLPIPLLLLSLAIPRRTPLQKFGEGRFRHKVAILLLASTLLCLGASFRAGTNYLPPHPRSDPPAYYSRACFYIFNFVVEILVVYLYVLVRVDRRFWIPNGSHAAGDYLRAKSGPELAAKLAAQGEKEGRDGEDETRRVGTEEEVFDEMPPEIEMNHGGKGSGWRDGERDVERGGLEGRTAVATPMGVATPVGEVQEKGVV